MNKPGRPKHSRNYGWVNPKTGWLSFPKVFGKFRISLGGKTYEISSAASKHEGFSDGYGLIRIYHVGDDRDGEGGYFDSKKFFQMLDNFYQEHF